MLYLAGMYTDFALPGGWERRYTILTTAANESMRPYHDRMPVYVATSERDVWINDSARTEAILHRAQPQLAATKVDKGGQMSFLL
jgi:putative SOS response-associated peptidase YedK